MNSTDVDIAIEAASVKINAIVHVSPGSSADSVSSALGATLDSADDATKALGITVEVKPTITVITGKSRTGFLPTCELADTCKPKIPVWVGRNGAPTWPPTCTPEGADKFQYGPPPDPGVECCDGLVACQEQRPGDFFGASAFDAVFACRKPECCCNPLPRKDAPQPTPAPTWVPTPGLTLTREQCAERQMPVWKGRNNATVWPPMCTVEAADKFQYGPPPDPGIPCCAGLVSCQEDWPADYVGSARFDSVFACRKPECCAKPANAGVERLVRSVKPQPLKANASTTKMSDFWRTFVQQQQEQARKEEARHQQAQQEIQQLKATVAQQQQSQQSVQSVQQQQSAQQQQQQAPQQQAPPQQQAQQQSAQQQQQGQLLQVQQQQAQQLPTSVRRHLVERAKRMMAASL